MHTHHLSRLLYRRLGPMLHHDPRQGGLTNQRQRLLIACERAMERLKTDPDHVANPAPYLFSEIRSLFSRDDLLSVRLIVEFDLRSAQTVLERRRELERAESRSVPGEDWTGPSSPTLPQTAG